MDVESGASSDAASPPATVEGTNPDRRENIESPSGSDKPADVLRRAPRPSVSSPLNPWSDTDRVTKTPVLRSREQQRKAELAARMGLKAQYLDRCSKHIRLHQEYEKLYQEHKKLHQQHQKLLRDYVKVSNALIKENQTLREFQKLLPQLVEFVDKALDDDQPTGDTKSSPDPVPSQDPASGDEARS
ncbi:MAG: hypothetical protein M1815_005604 [Lichina confinis]|nr:MAG: hypothetical protein M1815_005604 [Lichina confinis]